jgi:uncharacterized membrane protein YgcG
MRGRLALAIAIWFAGSAAAAAAAERIERFISDVQVQRNGDLRVIETIAIRAEGNQVKRGILRDFPTVYHRADGSRVEVRFDIESVTRDGQVDGYSTERMANGVRVRIGRADRTVNPGVHQYVIRYRTTRQIGFFKDYDELYWNATGTGWTFPIDVAEARINLPERVEFKQNAIYTGPQGANGKDAMVVEQQPGRIVFRTTRALPVANGLTVAAAWPKGIVAEPTSRQQIEAVLSDDPELIAAAVGGGSVLAFYLLAWLLVGRDPRRGTMIPLFAPPAGMSAASVRFVNEMGFDDRVMAAAIVGLGVNGRLKMTDDNGSKELHHLKKGKPADLAEQAAERALFAERSTVALSSSSHRTIGDARTALQQSLRHSFVPMLFRTHFFWAFAGLVAAAVATCAIIVAYAGSYGSSMLAIFFGTVIPLAPVMLGVAAIRNGRHQGGRSGRWRMIGGVATIAVALAIGIFILDSAVGTGPAMLPALVPSVLAAVATLGFFLLQAPTQQGRNVLDQIDGFKQYLSVAEEARLEYLNPPQKTPELFEKFLPYAIALNVENSWAQRFTEVLAAAGVAAAVSSWYSSSTNDGGDSGFSSNNVGSFADSLGDNLSTTIAAAATPPGSTGSDWSSWSSGSGGSDFGGGSSGGGSSGGGGGGGGGSGW